MLVIGQKESSLSIFYVHYKEIRPFVGHVSQLFRMRSDFPRLKGKGTIHTNSGWGTYPNIFLRKGVSDWNARTKDSWKIVSEQGRGLSAFAGAQSIPCLINIARAGLLAERGRIGLAYARPGCALTIARAGLLTERGRNFLVRNYEEHLHMKP